MRSLHLYIIFLYEKLKNTNLIFKVLFIFYYAIKKIEARHFCRAGVDLLVGQSAGKAVWVLPVSCVDDIESHTACEMEPSPLEEHTINIGHPENHGLDKAEDGDGRFITDVSIGNDDDLCLLANSVLLRGEIVPVHHDFTIDRLHSNLLSVFGEIG